MRGPRSRLAAVAHTLNHHRAQHTKFATVCAADRGEAVAGLRAVAAANPAARSGVSRHIRARHCPRTDGHRDTTPDYPTPPGTTPTTGSAPTHRSMPLRPLGSSGGSTAKPELASSNDEMNSLADLVEASELECATRAEKS